MIAYDWIDTQLAGQKDNSVTAASQQYSCITAVQAVQRGMSRAAWGRARRAGQARGKQREWRVAQQLRQAGRRAERAAGRAGIRPPMAHRTARDERIGGCGRGLALRASGVLGGVWGEGVGGGQIVRGQFVAVYKSMNKGLISEDRSNKATLLLTIPCSLLSRLQRIYRKQYLIEIWYGIGPKPIVAHVIEFSVIIFAI
jgi:hypothetical protein